MSFKVAYEFDENNIFLRDSIVFPTFVYITADNKEFDDFVAASEHQGTLFPYQAVSVNYLNDSENLDEGIESEAASETIFMEAVNVPEVQKKEIFILPDNCTWEPAPNPSNDAVWSEKNKKWINGKAPEMIRPEPSAVEILAQESADQLMHIAELEYKLDKSIQDNADLLMLIAEVM